MKYLVTIFIIIIHLSFVNAQLNYFKTDSILSIGLKINEGTPKTNAHQLEIIEKNKSYLYTPYDVNEYGFSDGRVYVSKSIMIDGKETKVFLLRLVAEGTKLYVYYGQNQKLYFIEKENLPLITLTKYDKNNNFRNVLLEITDNCQNVKNEIKLVSYTNNSLKKFISNYNSCKPSPLPFLKFGLLTGGSLINLETSIRNNYLASYRGFALGNPILRPPIGLFVDLPVAMSDFSIHADLYFLKCGYSFSHIEENVFNIKSKREIELSNALAFMKNSNALEPKIDKPNEYFNLDFAANISSINLPLLIRYTMPLLSIRPYVNAGFCLTYNFQNSSQFITTLVRPDLVQLINFDSNSYIRKDQFGICFGAGFEYKINHRNSLFFELRYNKHLNSRSNYYFNINQFQLFTGFNI